VPHWHSRLTSHGGSFRKTAIGRLKISSALATVWDKGGDGWCGHCGVALHLTKIPLSGLGFLLHVTLCIVSLLRQPSTIEGGNFLHPVLDLQSRVPYWGKVAKGELGRHESPEIR
jgi:hypothetical protein